MDSWAESDDDEEDDSEGGGGGGGRWRASMEEGRFYVEGVEEESEEEEMAFGLFDDDVSEDEMYRYKNVKDNENIGQFGSSSDSSEDLSGSEPEESVPKEEEQEVSLLVCKCFC